MTAMKKTDLKARITYRTSRVANRMGAGFNRHSEHYTRTVWEDANGNQYVNMYGEMHDISKLSQLDNITVIVG